ncbi:STYKc [Musa troglodytarum]|uniref:non-specific serine/threonine protein kinase n=1 Tax=Musa troglodytarum TaxID=320322 RepID=A0A9E7KG69_9LILI|nr:STYKc [Musa troglodytarum]
MWMFKPFTGKEPVGLEGRTIDVGNVKVHVRNVIAEGGFSCVYIALDPAQSSKQYALKHMICNDAESSDLVMKEISVMKLLRRHPNVVTLIAHTILDMGRRKEALLVMEYCEKSLVTVLGNRGAGYFEEKQILLIFRDVCNAIYAMHSQSPPIAHRDLKAENVLLAPGGAWKLCDFGSTSTNHKCFDKPEEMGIEEDIIRKHTTPAYRAPEMWDLFRKEVICEKVDIWALGCLLYRICYFKPAFDGESKLQVLNGNYRIPDLPKYSASMTDLIKDMLGASPNARPDIMQARALLDWSFISMKLELQKHLPDGCAEAVAIHRSPSDSQDQEVSRKTSLMCRRSPPLPPSSQESEDTQPSGASQDASWAGGPIGAFWSTQHGKDSVVIDNKRSFFNEPVKQAVSKQNHSTIISKDSAPRESHAHPRQPGRIEQENPADEDFEKKISQEMKHCSQRPKVLYPEEKPAFENETFNTFVADFDVSKLNSRNNVSDNKSRKEELEAEVGKLKEQLKQANLEKVDVTSKYEKLSAICRSQRQEIQELKGALSALSPSLSSKDRSKNHNHPGSLESAALVHISAITCFVTLDVV